MDQWWLETVLSNKTLCKYFFLFVMVTSLLFFQLTRADLDGYVGKELVPAFQIELKMIEFQSLIQIVTFAGVTPDNSFIIIRRDPKKQGRLFTKHNSQGIWQLISDK